MFPANRIKHRHRCQGNLAQCLADGLCFGQQPRASTVGRNCCSSAQVAASVINHLNTSTEATSAPVHAPSMPQSPLAVQLAVYPVPLLLAAHSRLQVAPTVRFAQLAFQLEAACTGEGGAPRHVLTAGRYRRGRVGALQIALHDITLHAPLKDCCLGCQHCKLCTAAHDTLCASGFRQGEGMLT